MNPKDGKSFIVSNQDVANGGSGLTEAQVNALIATAIKDLAKKADVYTKAEADAKFQPKA